MVPYADLILPDTTYLERWDCISLLDRPISETDGPADSIRQPVVQPNRDVRPFQDVLLDLGARLGLEGMVDDEAEPKYPGGYADYMVNHERRPGIGPLAGWRGKDGSQSLKESPTRTSSSATSTTAASGLSRSRQRRAISSTSTVPIWIWPRRRAS